LLFGDLPQVAQGRAWMPLTEETLDFAWEMTVSGTLVSADAAARLPYPVLAGRVALEFSLPVDEVWGTGSACFWITEDPDTLLAQWTQTKGAPGA
jgi:hypothetical protein